MLAGDTRCWPTRPRSANERIPMAANVYFDNGLIKSHFAGYVKVVEHYLAVSPPSKRLPNDIHMLGRTLKPDTTVRSLAWRA